MSERKDSYEYVLYYHPKIPGRGEYIRLLFEAAGKPYEDPSNESAPDEHGPNGYAKVQEVLSSDSIGTRKAHLCLPRQLFVITELVRTGNRCCYPRRQT